MGIGTLRINRDRCLVSRRIQCDAPDHDGGQRIPNEFLN